MDGIVELTHLVPVEFVPPRGRIARPGLDVRVTPVRIPEVDARDLGEAFEVGTGHHARSLVHHDGSLWSRLRSAEAGELSLGANPNLGGMSRHDYTEVFARSPLCPANDLRNDEIPRVAQGTRITFDGTDIARSDLLDFVSSRLLACRGVAYARVRGPLLTLGGSEGAGYGLAHDAWRDYGAAGTASPSRVAEHWAYLRRAKGDGADVPPVTGLEGLPDIDHVDDLLLFANAGSQAVESQTLKRAERWFDRDQQARMLAIAAELAPLARRGRFGAIGRAELRDAVETVGRLSAEVDAIVGPPQPRHWRARRAGPEPATSAFGALADYARMVALPALDAHDPADEAALAALGPGPR